jgi:hypothetical protein
MSCLPEESAMVPLMDPEILILGGVGLLVCENADDPEISKKENTKKLRVFIIRLCFLFARN